tara:strand:+ start:1497 stop:1628 length:132 start_codon:yes stop_codon:yes gene_type:complete
MSNPKNNSENNSENSQEKSSTFGALVQVAVGLYLCYIGAQMFI